ncbi:MAG: glycosyltransferase family 4 protein [Betaproteobacteria bacterium]|nr:MAG: glycosyltransferase family 4 protein [Betaproteobacteria bacterium]
MTPMSSGGGALNFCVVSTFYPPYNFGGDGIYAHRLVNGLARRGHRVSVIHSRSAFELLAGGPPSTAYADHPNVTVHGLRTPAGKWGLLAVQQTGRPVLQAAGLHRLLEGETFDVIHYNNVSLLGGPAVFGYGRGLKLCTLSDHWLVCPMHTLWKFDREVCTRPTCYRCALASGRPPQLWRGTDLMREATRNIDAFLGPSVFTIRKHQERGLSGTFIQLPQFHHVPLEGPADGDSRRAGRPYFLYAGRLEKQKGVQVVIPVIRARPDVDFLIAGSGKFEAQLRALAGGAANIEFLGTVGEARLNSLYRGAVATIVPSLCYETFGLVVVESFAAGSPVIVHARSAPEEIVRAHGGGLMYRDADELGLAIDRLRGDASLRQRLAAAGRAAFEREFSENVHLERYLALIRELLAKKRAGEPVTATAEARGQQLLAGRPIFFGLPAPDRIRKGH